MTSRVAWWLPDDGGRLEAGYAGETGDCVARSIAIANGLPYEDVCYSINSLAKRLKSRSRAHSGVEFLVYEKYLNSLGWDYVKTPRRGERGCLYLTPETFATGCVIVHVYKHLVAVVNGVLRDTFDSSSKGRRPVIGIFIKKEKNVETENMTLQSEVKDIFAIANDAILPDGFVVNSKGLWSEVCICDPDTGVRKISQERITAMPCWVAGNARSLQTNQGLVIVRYIDGDTIREIILPRQLIQTGNLVGRLCTQFGFHLDYNRGELLKQYLIAADAKISSDRLFSRTVQYVKQIGWVKTPAGWRFALYGANGVRVMPSAGFEKILNAFNQCGDRELYLKTIFGTLVNNPLACVPFAASVACPLIQRLGTESSIIDISHITTGGKTAAGMCAMSVYGDAGILITPWSSTTYGILDYVGFHGNLPVFLDEATTDVDGSKIMDVVYALGNPSTRRKVRPGGDTEETPNARKYVMSTSEAGLMAVSKRISGGVEARLTPVKGVTFGECSAEAVERVVTVVTKNFGWIGYELLSYLELKADFVALQRQHEEYATELRKNVLPGDTVQSRKARQYAVLICGLDCLRILYSEYSDEIERIKTHLFGHWRRICDTHNDDEVAFIALRVFMGHLLERPIGSKRNRRKYQWCFTENEWSQITKAHHWISENIINEFKKRDWLHVNETQKVPHLVRTTVNGENGCHVIALTDKAERDYHNLASSESDLT